MEEIDSLNIRTSSGKKRIGRAVSVNGVSAVDVELKQSSNLTDPILNVNVKVNNPIGRLWLALKRIWKSQNTVIALKFTIPLIVLPIAIYVLWAIWQGRGVSTPISKLGVIHQVTIGGKPGDILVVPTSDVYLLSYGSSFDESHRLTEKPVIIIGTYKHLNNTVIVDNIIAYNTSDIVPSGASSISTPSTWDSILRFIGQFK